MTRFTEQQKENFLEDLMCSLEDSQFLTDVYNDMKLEEDRYSVRDLSTCKKLIIDLGYKVEVKFISEYYGKRAVITQ